MGAERVEVFCFHLFAKPFVSISLLRQPHASRLLWPLRGHSARFLRARAREQNVCSQQQVQNGREKGSIGERRGRKEESEGGCERESLWPRPAAFRSSREKEEETLLLAPSPPLSLLRLSAASSSATTPELTIPSRSTTKKTTTPSLKNRSPGATPRMRRAASQLPRRTPSMLPRRPCLPLPRPSGSPRRARSPRRRWRSTPSP